MDDKEIQQALLDKVEREARDIQEELDRLAYRVKSGELTIREALSLAFRMGCKI